MPESRLRGHAVQQPPLRITSKSRGWPLVGWPASVENVPYLSGISRDIGNQYRAELLSRRLKVEQFRSFDGLGLMRPVALPCGTRLPPYYCRPGPPPTAA